MNISVLALAHEDQRRRIEEIALPNGQAIQRLDIPASAKLGNHFHRYLTETFIIVEGCGSLHTQKLNKDGQPIEDRRIDAFSKGSVITIEPLRAHTFAFIGKAVMIAISDRPLNPDAPDLNAFVLI